MDESIPRAAGAANAQNRDGSATGGIAARAGRRIARPEALHDVLEPARAGADR